MVYLVWDYDPMASSRGEDYIADVFTTREAAEQDVQRRNAAWRADFVKTAQNGRARAEVEPWNWRHARLEERAVKSKPEVLDGGST